MERERENKCGIGNREGGRTTCVAAGFSAHFFFFFSFFSFLFWRWKFGRGEKKKSGGLGGEEVTWI